MFENFLSFGSLIAVTFSIALTVKFLKVSIKTEIRKNSPNIEGNNNIVNIVEIDKKNNSNFKLLVNVIAFFLIVLLPVFPYFFISFMRAFSWLPIVISISGMAVNFYIRGRLRLSDAVYIIPSFIVGVLTYHSIYLAIKGQYLSVNIYPRLIEAITNFYISTDYLLYLNQLGWEFIAYVGFVILFLSAIYISFSFLKKRNFDETIRHIGFWIPFALVGDFFASGGMISLQNPNLDYIKDSYQLLFYFLKNPI